MQSSLQSMDRLFVILDEWFNLLACTQRRSDIILINFLHKLLLVLK